MAKNKRNNNNNMRRVRNGKNDGGIPNPTDNWSSTVKFTWTQRYLAQATFAVNITDTELLAAKIVAATATAGYTILSGVRLKRVQMWAAQAVAFTNTSIQCEFQTTNPSYGSSSRLYSDTIVGSANVAHVDARPDPESYSASWLADGDYSVLYMAGPAGTVIDVTMEVTLIDNEGAGASLGVLTIAGATVGTLYTRALDWNTSATLYPQSVNRI